MTTQTSSAHEILRRLDNEILIFDGATGTYLQQHGLESGGCPELMNADDPETIRQMARYYFDAGSDIVLTNTFGGTEFRLKHYDAQARVAELNALAAEHAKSQAAPGQYVAGSVGPTGEFLEPLGAVSEAEMYDAFTEQITALEQGGADAVMIETQMILEEAQIAIKATRENTDLLVMSTMVFDKGPRGFFTMWGTPPEDAAKGLAEAGADVVGSNCGNGIDKMIEIAEQMRSVVDCPIVIQSNAGIPAYKDGEIIYPETPEYMAERYKKLAEIPVQMLGGCCGATADHIRALAQAVK
jgi:5-methyltetrahydrofolate--homocysteine methyltransferase